MNPLATLRMECQKILEEALEKAYPGTTLPTVKYSTPPNPEMGELSSPVCFQLAREFRQAPAKIAETITEKIDPTKSNLITKKEALNGYINFYADVKAYSRLVLETAIQMDTEYGFLKTDTPQKQMVEHTSANPIGPLHVGNARNSILGACIANLLSKRGHDVIIHFLVNDMGRQVAMTTYGWKLLGKPEPEGRAELWVGTIYASVNVFTELTKQRANLKEAEINGWVYEASDAQEEIEKYEKAAIELHKRFPNLVDRLSQLIPTIKDIQSEIVTINTAYENNEPETVAEVREIIGHCLKGFEQTLGEIEITFNSFDFESNLVWEKKADKVLEALIESGYVIKDQGAQILDCDGIARDLGLKERWGLHPKHEIPRLVLVRSDGTTLYTLRDMAYSIWKFGKAERVINIIGQEQSLAQLQLRIALAAIDKMHMGDNQLHYAYEHVKLPGVKMSGRLGIYVTINEVLEKAVKLAYDEVNKRDPDLNEAEKRKIAKMVGHGAVKFTLLSVDTMKQVIFDWHQALNFETNSAPFIQYSHARTCNIIKKIDERPEPDYSKLTHIKERDLINLIAQFPETYMRAVEELSPGDITAYANNLADKFNRFYATQRVLGADSPELTGARLAIVDATRITLRNALNVLGIDAPVRM